MKTRFFLITFLHLVFALAALRLSDYLPSGLGAYLGAVRWWWLAAFATLSLLCSILDHYGVPVVRRFDSQSYVLYPLLLIVPIFLNNLKSHLALSFILLSVIYIKSFVIIWFISAKADDIKQQRLLLLCIFGTVLFIQFIMPIPHSTHLTSTFGDEPVYLLNTQSLVQDWDWDLRNNVKNKDYRDYYWSEIPEMEYTSSWMSRIGMAILLTPSFAIAGRIGAHTEIALLCALLGVQLALLLTDMGQRLGHSMWISWLVVSFTSVAFYSIHIFPEIPAAFILILVVRLFLKLNKSFHWKQLVMCLLLSLSLLLLKVRFLPLVTGLTLVLFYLCYRNRKYAVLIAVGILLALGAVGVLYVDLYKFEGALFIERYWRPFGPFQHFKGFQFLDDAIIGSLIDQEFGLLFLSPWLLSALCGLPILYRRNRFLLGAIAFAGGLYVANITIFRGYVWYGGLNPPGRFFIALVPLAALPLSMVRLPQVLTTFLVVWSGLSIFIGHWLQQFKLSWAMGANLLLRFVQDELHVPLAYWFPSFTRPSPFQLWSLAVSLLVAVGMCWLTYRTGHDSGPSYLPKFLLQNNVFKQAVYFQFSTLITIFLFAGGLLAASTAELQKWEPEDLPSIAREKLFPVDISYRLRQDFTPQLLYPLAITDSLTDKNKFWVDWPEQKKLDFNLERAQQFYIYFKYFQFTYARKSQGLRPVGVTLNTTEKFTFTPWLERGPHKFTIKARRSWHNWRPSIAPEVALYIDGRLVNMASVDTRLWQLCTYDYTVEQAGRHTLTVENTATGRGAVEIDYVAPRVLEKISYPGINLTKGELQVFQWPVGADKFRIDGRELACVDAFIDPWPFGFFSFAPGISGFEIDLPEGDYNITVSSFAFWPGVEKIKLEMRIDRLPVYDLVSKNDEYKTHKLSCHLEKGIHTITISMWVHSWKHNVSGYSVDEIVFYKKSQDGG